MLKQIVLIASLVGVGLSLLFMLFIWGCYKIGILEKEGMQALIAWTLRIPFLMVVLAFLAWRLL